MKHRIILPTIDHAELKTDIDALMKKHADRGLSAMEILAIASQVVGMLIALQDQRNVTRELAMETVIANLEAGNQRVLEMVRNTQGNG